MERISHLLIPPRRTSSAPALGAITVMALLLVAGFRLQAQSPDPAPKSSAAAAKVSIPKGQSPVIPKWITLPSGMKVGNEQAAIFIHSRNAKLADGKDIPFTQLLDIKADQVPLNQVWKLVEGVVNTQCSDMTSDTWDSRRDEIGGPDVTIDLDGVSPAEALALLNQLAKQHGVAPYQSPVSGDLQNIRVTMSLTAANPQAVICSAEISDPTTKKLAFAPRILVNKGEVGRATIGDSGSTVTFEISVDKDGATGIFSVIYSNNGKVVSSQKGKVTI